MNQPYARGNQPYATLTLASALRKMFGVQLYKNNARALLSRILSILNLDWLQHARSVRRVYEINFLKSVDKFEMLNFGLGEPFPLRVKKDDVIKLNESITCLEYLYDMRLFFIINNFLFLLHCFNCAFRITN